MTHRKNLSVLKRLSEYIDMNNLDIINKTAVDVFNIAAVKPFQLIVIDRILSQTSKKNPENQIVILPTGTGKSLCFLLPAYIINSVTVIVYPLLALMNDQIQKLKENGIDCICLRGGQTANQRNDLFNQLRNGTKIVVTNPETLSQKSVLNKLKQFKIELFVVDEAHVISKWGNEFRPSYNLLSDIIMQLKPHQILAFTATASENTVKDIKTCLFKGNEPHIVRGDSDRENINYRAYPTYNRLSAVREILSFCEKPAIVFCPVRHETFDFCFRMKRYMPDIPMYFYHAGLTKPQREDIEKKFSDCHNGVLFATSAYGMGIDKRDIRTVIHSSLPNDVESYLQESGRAGRDRLQSYAYAVIDLRATSSSVLTQIFTNNECRRYNLLKALGEEKETCTGCDVCDETVISSPFAEKEITALFRHYPKKYTAKTAAMILCGSRYYTQPHPLYGILKLEPELVEQTILNMEAGETPIAKLLKRNLKKQKRTR